MSKVCHNCEAEIDRNPKKHEELGYNGPLNKKDLTPHKCLERFENLEEKENHVKDVVPTRPQDFTADVADPTLVAVLAQLTDSIKLLTLAQLASNEMERNEIRNKINSGQHNK